MVITSVLNKISPMTEASFYILVSLAGPLHGYGIMHKVSEMSNGRLQLGPGTLYGALNNLQAFKLIEGVEDPGSPERRKLYRMTALGRSVAGYEIGRLEEMVRNGKRLLQGKG
jgi:DNA-binding PadR family transcriptional regulator